LNELSEDDWSKQVDTFLTAMTDSVIEISLHEQPGEIKNGNLGLFRGSFGLLLFNDVGRVWADNEKSNEWHDGYGWGILVAPLNRFVITAYLMYSKEEKNLLLLNLGFQF
jgi:hypothetical protein